MSNFTTQVPRIFLLLLITLSQSSAQVRFNQVVKVEAFLSVDKIRIGGAFKIGIRARIEDGWHINSHQPLEEFLVPTKIKFDSTAELEISEVVYPPGKLQRFQFSETPLSVYEGEITVWATVSASSRLSLGERTISGKFFYQACNDVSCLAPNETPFAVTAMAVDANTPVTEINEPQLYAAEAELGMLQGQRGLRDNKINQLIAGQGLLITLAVIFLGGLALNLTPCVYPVIPITISFFAGQASGKLGKSFLLALIYVSGSALTYSLLGVIAAKSGELLGSSLQNPFVLIAIAAVFLLFAASMFGAFEIRVPVFLSNLAGGSKQGYWGALFMGLTVGIVAAPCVGPFVLSLLSYVAAQGDPVLGFLMFFILALGLGLPFLVLGTFSGLIKNLPRSGEWMVWVKKVFGVIMIGMAVYFLSTIIPEIVYVVLLTTVALLGGAAVGFVDKSQASFNWFKGLKVSVGAAMILFGIWTSVSAWSEANTEKIAWQPYSDALVEQAKLDGQPVIIDFYAEWCIPCKQLQKTLFADPAIVAQSTEFVVLKADLTKEESAAVKALRRKYRVVGVPTVILMDRSGNEYQRFTDELVKFEPEEFLKIMQATK
jgi:thiol:disulfide interchange protein DsbD